MIRKIDSGIEKRENADVKRASKANRLINLLSTHQELQQPIVHISI